MPVPVPSRARVFISYKRHVQPDEFLALALYQGLSHLSGVVRREQGVLRVRDRIYHAVVLLLGLPVASQRQRVRKEQNNLDCENIALQETQTRQKEAEEARAVAKRLRLVSLAQALAAQASRQPEIEYDDERAALLARQAYLLHQRSQGEMLAQMDDALRAVLSRPHFQRVLRGHEDWVGALAWHPDGSTLASASTDGTVHL